MRMLRGNFEQALRDAIELRERHEVELTKAAGPKHPTAKESTYMVGIRAMLKASQQGEDIFIGDD